MNYKVIFERISRPETIEKYVTANSYWEIETEAQSIIYENVEDLELVRIEELEEYFKVNFELTFKDCGTNQVIYEVVYANNVDDAYRIADDFIDANNDLELLDVEMHTLL